VRRPTAANTLNVWCKTAGC